MTWAGKAGKPEVGSEEAALSGVPEDKRKHAGVATDRAREEVETPQKRQPVPPAHSLVVAWVPEGTLPQGNNSRGLQRNLLPPDHGCRRWTGDTVPNL